MAALRRHRRFRARSQAHYEALYYGARDGQITPEPLDAALSQGEGLTTPARADRSNPHRDILFRTDWDDLFEFDLPSDAGAWPCRREGGGERS